MTRDIGEFVIQELLPDWAVIFLGLLTQLGDLWFLGALVAVLYWTRPNQLEPIAVVGAVALAGIGVYRGLKHYFAYPRPDQPPLDGTNFSWFVEQIWEVSLTTGGFGFPSGHATSATIVYVGLAIVLPIGTRLQRGVGAALLIVIIGLSRIVLGVHFLVDIVAGIAIGSILLLIGLFVLDRRASHVFALSIVTALFYVAMSQGSVTSLIVLGAAIGGFIGWQWVKHEHVLPSAAPHNWYVTGGFLFVGLVVPAMVLITLTPLSPLGLAGASIVGLVTFGGIIGPSHRQTNVGQ